MTQPAILVCGGAGYIGSHMCKAVARAGYVPVVFDNFSTGHRWAVKWGPSIEGDLLDPAALGRAFEMQRFAAVMHFAARSLVGESMREPGAYFRNNVGGTLNLLDAMRDAGVGRLVFSSTAAVYGDPEYTPIDEAHPTRPLNPYGWSKLMAERVIAEEARANGLRAACLRYFNAAGADGDAETGEAHDPETHLVPNLLSAALDPRRGPARVFGNDYPTRDGTCLRDYVHVEDLCDAHLAALHYLEAREGLHVFNLGSGQGTTVLETVEACRRHAGPLPVVVCERRAGDPSALVADTTRACRELGTSPVRTLDDIVSSALRWARVRSAGA